MPLRNLLLAGLLLFCSVNATAQTWKELLVKFDSVYRKRDFNEALRLGEDLIARAKETYGEADSNYATSLYKTANVCYFKGQYPRAEKLYLEACEIRRKVFGENYPDYANCLNNLGNVYYLQKRFTEAEPLRIQVMNIRKKILGESHPDYIASVGNLALLYEGVDNYNKAEEYYTLAAGLARNALGKDHVEYARITAGRGLLYSRRGEYDKAEPLLKEAAEIRKVKLGEYHTDYINTLNALAILYKETAQFETAESLYLKIRELIRNSMGDNHPDYAQNANNLAVLYYLTGRYEKAEPLHLQAMELRKKIFGEKSLHYHASLNNLAILYEAMGLYGKAEKLHMEVLEMRRKASGENSLPYAESLNNLAILYVSMDSISKAIPLHKQAMEIRKEGLGEDHPEYANSLNNLAVAYRQAHDLENARLLYERSAAISKKILGANHPNYAQTINNLARIYEAEGNYTKAIEYFTQAESIRKNVLGANHPDYASTLSDLSLLYAEMNENEKAESYANSVIGIMLHNLQKNFGVLSENEKSTYLANNSVYQNVNSSFLFHHKNASANAVTTGFNLQVLLKSLALADTKNMLESIRTSSDTAIRAVFGKWMACKTRLASEYSKPLQNRMIKIDSLEALAENLEKELSRYSSAFRSQQQLLKISSGELKQYLKNDEAVIEFSRFNLYNKGLTTDSIIYGAYILKKSEEAPVFIPLFEEKQLQAVLSKSGRSATGIAKNIYSYTGGKSSSAATELERLIWQPLEPYLKGIRQVSYSPAGLLYGITLHALPYGNGMLMDKYLLQQYTSTRQLVFRKDPLSARPSNIIIFANADFSMDSTKLAERKKTTGTDNSYVYTGLVPLRGDADLWADLPGSAREMKNILSLFKTNKMNAGSFDGANASEENFKLLSNQSPAALHIATHGFFLPGPGKNKRQRPDYLTNTYKLSEDPMLRSGLVLSGGNYTWSGKVPIDGVEDGIVTAYEISQLNLSNTELLILSACETALGDIKGTEGVFGLQRAFKMAGVKKMIVSLWKVPDNETAELMTSFYDHWIKGKTLNEAFTTAQAEMRKKYPPFYWAAFILLE